MVIFPKFLGKFKAQRGPRQIGWGKLLPFPAAPKKVWRGEGVKKNQGFGGHKPQNAQKSRVKQRLKGGTPTPGLVGKGENHPWGVAH